MIESLTHLSLCTGMGGLDVAVNAVFDTKLVATAEIDEAACVVVDAHFGDVPNLGDITTIEWHGVRRWLTRARGVVPSDAPAVGIMTAGYP